MPLSKPVDRKHTHTRKISLHAYERTDGLWDIEGHLIDKKPYSFPNSYRGGYIAAGEHIHEMRLRLTIDHEKKIIAAEASVDYAPFPICPNIAPSYKKLVGEQIGPGWTKRTRELFGGTNGCTHLLELLGPMATTAYQAMFGSKSQSKKEESKGSVPGLINTCHAWSASSPIVKELYPEFYKPADDK